MYRGLKISKNPLLRNSKNHNFSPQLDPLGLFQNADEAENKMHFETTLIKAISSTKFEINLFLDLKRS
jgi:hypothetical protein